MRTKFTEYKGLDLPLVAEEVLKFWKENNVFEQSVTSRDGATPYVFFEGPPSANGLPGIHHVMARAIKDIFCRYKTQKGFQVKRKAGWDTHGLPVELGTEKELGITKEDIGKTISVTEYNEACKRTVMRYTDVWNDLTEKMGYWVDMNDPYVTYKSKYMETVWWLLQQIYNKNLLYKGYTIQPYSPKAGTGLSSHEVNQPGTYRDVTDTTIVAQFKAVPDSLPTFLHGFGDIHFLAWTTTPWTLPSNTALTVGPKIDYVLVKSFNQYTFEPIQVILAKPLLTKVFGGKYAAAESEADFTNYKSDDKKIPYAVLAEFKGADLVGIRYEQLLNIELPFQSPENAFRVISGDFVTTEDGTGIVHTAPTFGADDAKVASEAHPPVPPFLISRIEKKFDFVDSLFNSSIINYYSGSTFSNYINEIESNSIVSIDNEKFQLLKNLDLALQLSFKKIDFFGYKEILNKINKEELYDAINDDYWEGAREGSLVPIVDLQGKFLSTLKVLKNDNGEDLDLAGQYVKDEYYDEKDEKKSTKSVDVQIAIYLKENNKAFKVEKYVHSYPHCWRTDKPILYYPLDSWFIKITEVKDRMFDLNDTINWKPKATGEGRFGNWLKNANDWNLSRSRYWGIPLPIWRTEDKTEEICIGSVEQLYNEIEKAVAAGVMNENPYRGFEIGNMDEANYDLVDLHKNIVDNIVLVAPSGKAMKRESDLIDVWFDSGAMPYAQWHYPFENKAFIDNNEAFPADFIAEGVDQTRGWFYTLHAIGTLVFDKIAYKNVVSNGLVLDKNGQKMSKRLGNAVDPFETLKEYGPDATRWYMISNANPWDNLKFDIEGVAEVRRKFFGTLYNTYSFFALYANIDGFTNQEAEVPLQERPEIDRWILSELHTLIQTVDEAYADYEPTKATRAISDFVQENLSNWYVRLCRRRFWKGEYGTDKVAAYQTLYTCLVTVAKLSAPVAPFFMDQLYRDLVNATGSPEFTSVHLANFPQFVEKFVDKSLERKMLKAQTVSSLVLSLRKKEMIKVRQPLQRVMIPVLDATFKAEIEAVSDLIKSEVNVKEVALLDDASGVLVKQIKPNFKALGPRFGKDMGLISKAIQDFSQEQINTLDAEGTLDIEISEKKLTLTSEDVEITSQDIPGWLVANANGITVALDITLTPALKEEGIARELVNRIQNIRKDSGFEVTNTIEVVLQRNGELEQAIENNKAYVCSETLTRSLTFTDVLEEGIELEFDDIKTKILISK